LLAWRYRLEQDLIALCQQNSVQLVVRDDTHFMCSKADFKHYAADGKNGPKMWIDLAQKKLQNTNSSAKRAQ
jgi:deoxyribodipyrimidine photolyase-like uncharacterized protein